MDLSRYISLPYRPGVGIVLFNSAGRVLMARRRDMPSEAWQMPQGGIDEGETPLAAAWREMKEEIGTDDADLLAETRDWLTYDLPMDLAARLWGGQYRGQKQKWFAFRFRGTDSDIDIDTENPEFLEWQWMDFDKIADLIVAFKRPLYQEIIKQFKYLSADCPV